jgi:hypothetical protein
MFLPSTGNNIHSSPRGRKTRCPLLVGLPDLASKSRNDPNAPALIGMAGERIRDLHEQQFSPLLLIGVALAPLLAVTSW